MKSRGLEAVFHEATQQHGSLALLYSQWSFDKELIAKALQNIVSIFPHYSRHDASHSRQIIVNIERMLGDRIFKLTATDMWLILESAYSHDIGMVITHKQIEDMDSQAFRDFVEDIANDPSNDLSGFASQWLAQVLTLPQGQAAHTLFEEYKQLLAEWYRRKHPQSAEAIMCNPYDEIGLTSPRNELLPKRLFRALGAICRSHGQSFEDVMKLPFSEAGMGTEDCHPRYVACLLRMADLLDIDDNRFCPVMMRMSGVELPHTSHAHYEKHQAIRHFRLDAERIKIEVACPTPESYEVAHDWFRWLEQEYHSQSQHWPKIVPSKKLGRLPTLAPPKVVLDAPYVTLSEGKRPGFEIDKEAILALVRGTGLYKTKFDSIREVLQNAVDATLLWIWREHEALVQRSDPTSSELQAVYKDYMVSVDVKEVEGASAVKLSVFDRGTGVSRNDLGRMMVVGGSTRNTEKLRKIRRMPKWFRPSGTFGIGLQSIYLLSDKFSMTTKSRLTHEAFKVQFNSKGQSSLVITELDPAKVAYGTLVEVDVAIDEFPRSISAGTDAYESSLTAKLRGYDFTKKRSNLADYEKTQILRALAKFGKGSPIKIVSGDEVLGERGSVAYYCEQTHIVLRDIKFAEPHRSKVCFRGQPVKDSILGPCYYYAGIIDFYGESAFGFLSYNRDELVGDARGHAREMAIEAVLGYIEKNYVSIPDTEKPYAAATMLMNGRHPIPSVYDVDARQVKAYVSDKSLLVYSDLLEAISSGRVKSVIQRRSGFSRGEIDIPCSVRLSDFQGHNLLAVLATRAGLHWRDELSGGEYLQMSWWNEDVFPVSGDVLRGIMQGRGFDVGRRILFPAWGKYRKLAVAGRKPWANIHRHLTYQDDYLVFPYALNQAGEVAADVDDALISWVYDNRKHEDISWESIRQLYQELEAYIAAEASAFKA